MLDSCLIHRGLLDSFSTPLDRSRSSCMHCFSHVLHISFILLSIASRFITFMHFYRFFVPPWSSLIIFIFLGWSVLASCTLCQSWQKGGGIVEIWGFFLKILYVRGRNTCLYKGEMCFILLGGVLTSFFLYTGLVTMFTYIVLIFDIYIYIYMMYVSFTYPYMCCFFFLFMYMFLITCMQSIISVSHKYALMNFVSSVSKVQVVKVYLP